MNEIMTPIETYLHRILPKPLVLPALASIYAALILGSLLAAASVEPNIYLNVGAE